MKEEKIWGIIVDNNVYKAYELFELEGSGLKAVYILMCNKAQINSVVSMLNKIA